MKNHSTDFDGVWTAIATPFTKKGAIDLAAFKKHLKQQEDGGVSGIVVCGTTGESPTLSNDEKIELIEIAREHLGKKVRVMAGTGGNDTKQSVELSKLAVKAGADSLLIVTPPYNKPSVNGLKLHYGMIADSVEVPICLYHVPGRTAQMLTPDAIAQICSIKKVSAVKEASGDVALFSRALLKAKVTFLSGDDPTYLASLSIGGRGCISVAANVFPKEMVAMTKSYFKGETEKALAIHNALLSAIDVLFCETNPGPLKAALEVIDLGENRLRAPLAPVSKENYAKIKDVISTTSKSLKVLKI